MALDPPVPYIKGFVVNEETNNFAIRDIDNGLPGLGVAISRLCIWQWAQLIDGVQVGTGKAMRLPLIEVAPKPNMSIGEGENGFRLCQDVKVESRLANTPLINGESGMIDHKSVLAFLKRKTSLYPSR